MLQADQDQAAREHRQEIAARISAIQRGHVSVEFFPTREDARPSRGRSDWSPREPYEFTDAVAAALAVAENVTLPMRTECVIIELLCHEAGSLTRLVKLYDTAVSTGHPVARMDFEIRLDLDRRFLVRRAVCQDFRARGRGAVLENVAGAGRTN